ncbi:MAG: carboxypeptidase regulatory-like domain-containing protein [Bacteroidales bacterium]|nr:carboxypeptidase regulatory-like domain-containing protein [Bacteroidales bacterium]
MKKFYTKVATIFLPVFFFLTFSLVAQMPVIYFDPGTLEADVAPNDSAVVHSVLHNFTTDTVEFFFSGYSGKDWGGPDNFGYSWIDSDEPGGPDWAWTDISENGILIEGLGDDAVVGPFEMDINFKFYGETRTQFWVNSNGCISFNDQLTPFANTPIPTNDANVEFVAWFWDDLTIDSALTSVYFKNFEEKTIVQFNKMVHYPGTESFITAQVVFVNNGTIFIRYKQVHGEFETNSATIGLQSWNPELGLQVAYNEEYVHSELAVRFDLNRNFITSVNPSSFYLPPNTQETIWITYSSAGFETGSFEQDLKCITSHPEYPHLLLHNVMHVTGSANAGFKGYVTDAATGFAVHEVLVKVGEHQTYTNDNGYYELPLEQGEYDVTFVRSGYQTLIVSDTTALPGFSILDVALEGYYFIAGQVFAGENIIESGFAYGYKMMEETVVDIYAEMVGGEGWYEFSGLASAGYIIKAEPSPNSMYYGDYLPTYFGDVIHWEEASVINLPGSTDDAHIHLVAAVSAPTGPGNISGTIENNGRAAGIPIVLRSDEAVIMTYSSTDGTYHFSGLAYGTYEIFAEIPGKSVIPQIITLDETHPSAEGIDMLITENEIVFLGIAESEIFETRPYIYPNPVTDEASMVINLKKPADLRVLIFDPAGKVCFERNYDISGQEVLSVNLADLSKGIYLMKMAAGGEILVRKLVKY